MSLLVQIAAQFTGKKAFKEADKSVKLLENSARKLGATLGVSLSTAAVVAFGKASVKAFMDDEKAASRLAKTVDNLGLSFANPQITTFVDDLSKATGVVDDQLRPAMQALLTTTGSVIQSQKLLAQAIDISAGSGVDLGTVSQDLANAYVGITKGLKKYNLGLTQAELKSASFAEIQDRLTKQFSGANAQYLTTYSGKMQLLTTAAGEAQEVIGGALIDSLVALGGDTSVEDLADSMNNLATYTGNVIRGIGNLAQKLDSLPKIGDSNILAQLLTLGQADKIKAVFDYLAKSGSTKQSTGFSFFGSPMEDTQKKRDAAAAAAAEKKAKDNAKRIADSLKKNTAELKKQAALKKAGTLFDLEQIGIIAALKGNISEEDRLRLKLQLAILTENDTEASKLTRQLAAAQGLTKELTDYLGDLPTASNPFAAWKGYLDAIELQAQRIASFGSSTSVGAGVPATSGTDFGGNVIGSPVPNFTPPSAGTYGTTASTQPIVIQIEGKTIASVLMDQSLSSGNQAYINRRTGGFE